MMAWDLGIPTFWERGIFMDEISKVMHLWSRIWDSGWDVKRPACVPREVWERDEVMYFRVAFQQRMKGFICLSSGIL